MNNDFSDFSNLIKGLYSQLALPLLGIASGAALLLGLWLGCKFWFSGGDEQKIKKAKESVKFFAIGIVVIFVVAAATPLLIGAFTTWLNNS